MHRRRLQSAFPLALGALVVLALYFHLDNVSRRYHPGFEPDLAADEIPPGGKISRGNVSSHITAILDPQSKHLSMLDCSSSDLSRYEYLRPTVSSPSKTPYFFALNLRENLAVLPRLLRSVIQAIEFLGPEHCALSIVEGNSPDGTGDVLAALEPLLKSKLGLQTHFVLGDETDPLVGGGGARFAKLAQLRNQALAPMLHDPDRYADATVIFVNDVVICPDDIVELIHQRQRLGADMTCAMDWIYGGEVPTFYDVYIARGINGDLLFNIPPETVSWSEATKLFWNEPESKSRFYADKPVQVFSCWNGAVAFTAKPLVDKQVAFRAARQNTGECYNGEPEIFCKDMWFNGYGKIAMLPYVNLVYDTKMGKRVKDEKGYTSQRAPSITSAEDLIEWKQPPEKVKCMPTFDRQSWHVWNETLERVDL